MNFPSGTPGIGANLYQTGDRRVVVVNVMGQLFMETLDDPFVAIERELKACPLGEAADAIIVDVHAEATSEKMAMGHFCDGRAAGGQHYTHVPTADAQILPNGTAYQTDAGMCGDYDSVIGMEKEEPKTLSHEIARWTFRTGTGHTDTLRCVGNRQPKRSGGGYRAASVRWQAFQYSDERVIYVE